MSKYRIAFIDYGGRSFFKEALPHHHDVIEVDWISSYRHCGKPILKQKNVMPIARIINQIEKYDLIFKVPMPYHVPNQPNFSLVNERTIFMMALEEKGLWDRTIIWDYADEPSIVNNWEYDRCLVYFKKNWPWGTKQALPKMFPLNFAVLDLYIDAVPIDTYKHRDIDIGCYFGYDRYPPGNTGRHGLVNQVKNFNWPQGIVIDMSYTCSSISSTPGHALYEVEYPFLSNGNPNPWFDYMNLLRRTKIVLTCSGGPYNKASGGDVRECEALASGALVVMGQSSIMDHMPNPFIHGKHCFFFDMTNKESIKEAVEIANLYLTEKKTEEREAMARACFDHACKYHRSKNYVDYAMDIVKKRLNE